MEGLLPYVYRAIIQHRAGGQRLYGALATSSPGDSGRLAWDSAYMRLPGDSGRFASEIHERLMESLPASAQSIYRSLSLNGRESNLRNVTSAPLQTPLVVAEKFVPASSSSAAAVKLSCSKKY